jgi:phosphoglycolate phosphatase
MNNYKLYIFDWDGTLMDSIDRIVSSMQAAAVISNLLKPSDDIIKNVIGLSLHQGIMEVFPDISNAKVEEVITHYKIQYAQLNETPSPLFSHAEHLLLALRQNDKLLAIATGKGRNGLERVLKVSDTTHYFHSTRCADDALSKPDPDMLLQLLNEFSLKPEDAVIIGDSRFDLEMAQRANIHSIGVSMGAGSEKELSRYNPQAIVHSLYELANLIT